MTDTLFIYYNTSGWKTLKLANSPVQLLFRLRTTDMKQITAFLC